MRHTTCYSFIFHSVVMIWYVHGLARTHLHTHAEAYALIYHVLIYAYVQIQSIAIYICILENIKCVILLLLYLSKKCRPSSFRWWLCIVESLTINRNVFSISKGVSDEPFSRRPNDVCPMEKVLVVFARA